MNASDLLLMDFLFDAFSSLAINDENDTFLIKKNVKIDYTIYNKLVQIAASQDIEIQELIIDIYMLYINEFICHNSKKNDYFNN